MITITSSVSFGGRRQFLAVNWNSKKERWVLQWAHPTAHGHRFDPSLPDHAYKTKREAIAAKRKIYEEIRW